MLQCKDFIRLRFYTDLLNFYVNSRIREVYIEFVKIGRSTMHSQTVYLLLVLSIAVAVVTAYEDDEFEDGMLFNLMDKRKGRRGKGKGGKGKGGFGFAWKDCPENEHCVCLMTSSGEVMAQGSCTYEHNKGYGL
ncbi:hypothetical protein HOLleu_22481 [Holothuria leucospilota]|uniref:Uncharacterized protein n=1 Tax=Holothuria leucospilota TaxID=206669 RepID=A0A9Q1BZH4_HOLLE|nr:hypothetical protein HOLleu_22481 [Holothuria leucospilota]